MGNAAFIVWRETIEAMLVVGILHGWLAARSGLIAETRRRATLWLWGGVGAGLGLAALLALALLGLSAWASDTTLEWFQAGMPLVAAVLIFQMVAWMRRHGAGLKKELESGMSAAVERAHWAGMALLATLADPLWDASGLLDDSTRFGGLLAAFTGWRSLPTGMSYLVLAAWWTLAIAWVLRAKPVAVKR